MANFELERLAVKDDSTTILRPLEKGTILVDEKTAKEYKAKKDIHKTGMSIKALLTSGLISSTSSGSSGGSYDDTHVLSEIANNKTAIGTNTASIASQSAAIAANTAKKSYPDADKAKVAKMPADTKAELAKKADKTELANKADKSYTDSELAKKADKTELAKKVDKVAGKQLSTEDFTTAEKTKLAGLGSVNAIKFNVDTESDIPTGSWTEGDMGQIRNYNGTGHEAIAMYSDNSNWRFIEQTIGRATVPAKANDPEDYKKKEWIKFTLEPALATKQTLPSDPAKLQTDQRFITIANAFGIEHALKQYIDSEFIDKWGSTPMATEYTPATPESVTTRKYVDAEVSGVRLTVVDDVSTGGSTSALSAEQGKLLDARINTNQQNITNLKAFGKYVGTFDTEAARDKSVTNPEKGDYALIGTSSPYTEYVYDNGAWEQAGIASTPTGVKVVDDLTTGGSSSALSAEQGKALKTMVDVTVKSKPVTAKEHQIKQMVSITQADYDAMGTGRPADTLYIING